VGKSRITEADTRRAIAAAMRLLAEETSRTTRTRGGAGRMLFNNGINGPGRSGPSGTLAIF
jgi:hypothetical protein